MVIKTVNDLCLESQFKETQVQKSVQESCGISLNKCVRNIKNQYEIRNIKNQAKTHQWDKCI